MNVFLSLLFIRFSVGDLYPGDPIIRQSVSWCIVAQWREAELSRVETSEDAAAVRRLSRGWVEAAAEAICWHGASGQYPAEAMWTRACCSLIFWRLQSH